MIKTTNTFNPFPGLRPFNENENHLFFGRESQVDELINKLSANKFLAVIGTSGSGKSSLVNCGLFPALHGGYMSAAGSSWRIVKFRPGHNPIREMALAMAKKNVLFTKEKIGKISLSSIILTNLQRSKLGLIETYKQARLAPNENLLIVADQFEEIFRFRKLRKDYEEHVSDYLDRALAFVNLLLSAAQQTEVPIYVVITMRSDFLGDCAAFRGLPEAINKGQYLVPRMKRKERKKAIEGPIEVAGAKLTDRLLMRLVNDVGDNPDQLSILQHALNRTWAEWEKGGNQEQPIDLEHYNKIGTMLAALDQHANRAYKELETPRAMHLCEKMFKALTDIGIDSRGIRRPTQLGTLCNIIEATEEEVIEVIDIFRKPSRSFLMPPADRKLDSETIIDISHESFMRIWKRLIKWTDEEQESVRTYHRLSDAAILYKEKKSTLLGDPYLSFALNWKKTQKPNAAWGARYDNNFEEVIDFLDKSKKNWLREEKEKKTKEMVEQTKKEEEQRQKEIEQKRKTQRARKLAAIVSLAAIISLGLAVYGYFQKRTAEKAVIQAGIFNDKLVANEKQIMKYFGGSVDLKKIVEVSSMQDTIQQMEIDGTTDAELLSMYKTLLDNYPDQLKDDSIINNKIRVLSSFDQFILQDSSDNIPIWQKYNSWNEFVSFKRNTAKMKEAKAKKQAYETYIAENATILNEHDFVTSISLNSDNSRPTNITNVFKVNSKVKIWARVNAPKDESLTVRWYYSGQERPFVSNSGNVESNVERRGYRIYFGQTYNSSRTGKKNEVRLYNSKNDLIGRKVFTVTD